ncbi:hypothetical protein MIR68_008352 [Amoeboaphelidium protococcarum]|nr:hypothetical protein MIR68_008352 [Amoeboaphelidium protococcarum]
MVVLSASICTKSGNAVVSRQFIEVGRSRIEGLLASFPKLISSGQQHTFVETDSVRFVYQPLDELYMVLITNKQSNILQDIDTLHLFARTASDLCKSMKVVEVAGQAFDLIMAFDEIVSAGGLRENVDLSQIRTNIAMESHEEKLAEIMQKNKEREAAEAAKKKAKEFEIQKRAERAMKAAMGGSSSGGMGSAYSSLQQSKVSPGSGMGGSQYGGRQDTGSFGSGGSGVGLATPSNTAALAANAPKKGLQLGSKQKMGGMFDTIRQDEGIPNVPALSQQPGGLSGNGNVSMTSSIGATSPQQQQQSYQSQPQSASNEAVQVVIDEKIIATLHRDGGLENLDVKGEMTLRCQDANKAKLKLQVQAVDEPNLTFKTHPHVDKQLWSSSHVITTKDANKSFPLNQNLPVLKWRYSSKDESMVPLSVSVWPSVSGNGSLDCSLEYELLSEKLVMKNVVISIPVPALPKINNCDGDYQLTNGQKTLEWRVLLIDADSPSGTLEFSIKGTEDVNALFPVKVQFNSDMSFCAVALTKVLNGSNGGGEAPVAHSKIVSLSAEDYTIV